MIFLLLLPSGHLFQEHTACWPHALVFEEGREAPVAWPVPRVARLLALAHHFQRLLAEGIVYPYGKPAAVVGVKRPRAT